MLAISWSNVGGLASLHVERIIRHVAFFQPLHSIDVMLGFWGDQDHPLVSILIIIDGFNFQASNRGAIWISSSTEYVRTYILAILLEGSPTLRYTCLRVLSPR